MVRGVLFATSWDNLWYRGGPAAEREEMMEEEYMKYLRENAPELYQQCIDAFKHQFGWRDNLINEQAEQIGKLREKLDEISNTYPIRCTGLKNGSLCACQIIQEIVNEAAPPQKGE